MYKEAVQLLQAGGLAQYEISAFAKTGYKARHNTGYWTGRPFIGLGPSAFSYWEGKRFRCISHLKRYVYALQNGKSPVDFEECLEPTAHLLELLIIQLRLCEGVHLPTFEQQQGRLNIETYRILLQLQHQGWLEIEQDRLRLTQNGILFYDSVATELVCI
jgi:oxygen-independent coproporphyrinogen-3 oxidase